VVISADGYVLIAVVEFISSSSAAHPVIYALAPISLAAIALKGISARRLRDVVTALDSPHFTDVKAEIVKRTQGLHQSTAAGISILLTLATVLPRREQHFATPDTPYRICDLPVMGARDIRRSIGGSRPVARFPAGGENVGSRIFLHLRRSPFEVQIRCFDGSTC